MDLEYLINEVLPQRKKEIEDGKNLSTRQPIYVVLELIENIMLGHNEYSSCTNYKNKDQEFGYVDLALDSEDMEFKITDEGMKKPTEITKYYTDRFAGFFLTSKSAHEYMEYQKHNLINPYVYVFNTGYRNQEMDLLLKNE